MTKKRLIPLLLLIIILISGAIWFINKSPSSLVLYGNVDIRTVNSSFRVSGRLMQLNYEEGDHIKQGDLLAKLDVKPYQNAFNQAKANLMVKQAQLDLMINGYRKEEVAQAAAQVLQNQASYDYAENNYQRMVKLMKSLSISKDQLENSLTLRNQANANLQTAKQKFDQLTNGYRKEEIEAAQATLQAAQAELDQAELNLLDTELYAPTDGTILTRAVESGTMLTAGSPIYAISIDRPVWVRAYIDEINLHQAIPGRTVYVYTDSQPDKTYIGQIGFVSPTAEFTPKTVETPVLRTDLVYRLRIQIRQTGEGQADDMLRQGMPVTIKFAQ
ncbi:secretion protein HlyD [Gilliamella sp. ESL0443]|uniref:secretion protein HlyD n=1 Tax=Gilliamella sp. ESL0443 TaxID=2704655 RepID=UPI001C697EC3|nr:secretion protein HlyD [Gilliamella sp. ESL0443]QYN41741.1 secretion protein HlyD [Gilliamella sp. ESL0443]